MTTSPHKISRRLDPNHRLRVGRATVREWMVEFAASIRQAEDELTELDRAIGDGDHGVNMVRGTKSVLGVIHELQAADLSGQFRAISRAFLSSVGGASGPLYGAFFLQGSHCVVQKQEISLAELTAVFDAGFSGITQLGKATVGDKTMVDTLSAAVQSLRASCARYDALPHAVALSAEAARQAAAETAPLIARKGRASYLGERSAGVQDPGATSAALLVSSLSRVVRPVSPSPSPVFPHPQPQTANL
jgi:dihydroxyacetone kinase-like protein